MKKTNLKSLETVTHGNLIDRQKYIENSSIFKKKNEGITLIALVITIVILIILVGVSINTLIGENGIITQAKQANLIVIESELKSKVQLIKLEYETNNALEENNLQLYDYLNQAKEKGEFDEVIDDGKGNITVIWQGCSTTITGGEVDLNRYTEPGIYDSDFNLIYSWETALSQGKLTVENGILSTYNVDIESPVIILGDNVTSIQDETFAQTDIMGLGISKNVTSIQSNICKDCSNLKFVAVSEENETYTSQKNTVWKENWIIIGSNNSIISKKEDIYISDYAFSSRNLNNSLNMKDVVYFGQYSFYSTQGKQFLSNTLGNTEGTPLIVDKYAFNKCNVVSSNLTLNFLKSM